MLLREWINNCTSHTMLRAPGRLLVLFLACCASVAQADTTLTFATQQTFATGTGPHAIAALDLNNDGKLDLVIANEGSDTLSLLINTTAAGASTPTFTTQTTLATDKYPVSIAKADINGDGKPDLIVANAEKFTISVLLNTTASGASTPTFAAQQTFATGTYPFWVSAADIDGDGKPDLVVANAGSSGLSVFRNTTTAGAATASFATPQFITTGIQPASIAITDVNGDGKPDLVVANYSSATASVLLNTTAAGATTLTFADQLVLITNFGPSDVTVSDINGDGKPDVIVVNSLTHSVSVFLNTTTAAAAAAVFAAPVEFQTGVGAAGVATADFNGDGKPDIVVTNQTGATASVLLNTTAIGAAAPTFAAQQTFTTGTDPVAVVAADINSDGIADLIVANNQAATASVLLNTTSFPGVNLNQHGITGSWFNAATGGQGLEIELYPNVNGVGQGLLFGGWFTYDVFAAGGQRWYALEGGVNGTNPTTQLGIYAGLGGNFAAGPVVPATQVGNASLHLSDCGNGTLTYSFYDGRTGTIPISRLTANITCGTAGDNGNAPSDYLLSGSWFETSTGGQGLVFDVNPTQNNFFAAWYTYAPNGQQTGGAASERWYTIQAAFAPGAKVLTNAPIYATSGGVFDNATAPTATPVGTATITFVSCSSATLTYAFTSGVNSGLSGTINLTRTGPTPAGCSL